MAIDTQSNQREKRTRDFANALASVRMEGLEPSAGAHAIFQRYLDGDLSLEQAAEAIREHADREYGPVRLSGNERP